MKLTYARRYRRSPSRSRENALFKKDNQLEPAFFATPARQSFFKPNLAIQRKCDHCAAEDKKVNRMSDSKEEEKKVQKMEDKKEEEKPVQKMADKKEEKEVQKMEEKKEEKEVQKMEEKKEEEKPIQKMTDTKEEEKRYPKWRRQKNWRKKKIRK
ncbi:hypothetical protein [Adhaeribacter pallidiroseus]|uniref:1-phosphatidylinositol-4-phosphate 5-kinase n=1 Tax=Adhaeribacter pallidiroseus TaxID=2072847 RepID=A0A369QCP7_9BACT|nr:hypothetical protein [Adhaeribacter pallidiroseus]RDC62671.1 1-phosphatidylinositol-4-phosphate 5-kinase [Adhaeribacter pallidiroseus]